MQPTYDITKSTEWNIENGPLFTGDFPVRGDFPMKTKLWDFELNSPLGIPAGPLFNGKFIELYGKLGFDILTYKTVRSVARSAHQNPNIVYVDLPEQIKEEDIGSSVHQRSEPENLGEMSITNSYGMNSLEPSGWQADMEKAMKSLSPGQLMIGSVVGTPEQGDLIEDYVRTAALAKEAGAPVIEVNYSCPNVVSGEGMICFDPHVSSEISRRVKEEIGNIPFVIKLGYYDDPGLFADVVAANAPFVDGIALINTIKMAVVDENDQQVLPGEGRLYSGICGNGIRDLAQKAVKDLASMKKENGYDFEIIGVGGIVEPKHVDEYLDLGARVAMTGTGAMWDPYLAYEYHKLHGGK